MRIGSREFDTERQTYIMGILNVTPDSFSDGGKYNHLDAALFHAEEMVRDGADIIDVGGESTRPGFEKISDEEETERVAPVIEALTARLDVPVSVDTYKSRVAKAALSAGASLINDIWGFKADRNMAAVAAETGAACCLMHNRERADYQDFLKDMIADLRECVELARKAGVADDRIILDPGVGFGKNYHLNHRSPGRSAPDGISCTSGNFEKISDRHGPGFADRPEAGGHSGNYGIRRAAGLRLPPGS